MYSTGYSAPRLGSPSIFTNPQYILFFVVCFVFSIACIVSGSTMIGLSQKYGECRDDCVDEPCTSPCGESSTCTYQCRCGAMEDEGCKDPPTYTDNWALNRAGVAFLVIGLVLFFVSVCLCLRACAEAQQASKANSLAAVRPYGYPGPQEPFGANYAPAPNAPPMQAGYQMTAVTTYPQAPYMQNQYAPSSNAHSSGASLYLGSQPGIVYQQQPGIAPAGPPVAQAVVIGHY